MPFKNSRLQGDAGVAAALAYYTSNGWPVSVPFGEGQRYDLIVDRDGVLSRVQVKTAFSKTRNGTYQAELRTCGGNMSGRGKVSRISTAEVDEIAIVAGDGSLWIFPANELEGRRSVSTGKNNSHRKVL